MREHLLKLKAELKVLSTEIRTFRKQTRESNSILDKSYPLRHDWNQRKQFQKVDDYNQKSDTFWKNISSLNSKRMEFRIKHITYCMLRGKTIEQIEPSLRVPNSYEHSYIRKKATEMIARILEEVNGEAVRSNS